MRLTAISVEAGVTPSSTLNAAETPVPRRAVRSARRDLAVANQHRGVLDLRPGDRVDRPAGDRDRLSEQEGNHGCPSVKWVLGWCAGSFRSYTSQPSL